MPIDSDGAFRIEPAMPPNAYKTYSIASPKDVGIVAACHEVGCESWQHGWETFIDESTPLGKAQARYIRRESRRDFKESRNEHGITVFRFSAFQRCFEEHMTQPEYFGRTLGDWRCYTGETFYHTRPADWVEDFGEHQQRIADQIKEG